MGGLLSKESLMKVVKGTRVKVFDPLLFKNDITTPLSVTMKPGTVIKRYAERSKYNPNWIYPDLIDVRFDHIRFSHLKREERYISRGHFTEFAEIIEE